MFSKWCVFTILVACIAYLKTYHDFTSLINLDEIRENAISFITLMKNRYLPLPDINYKKQSARGLRLFTEGELRRYTGERTGIYLSIMGNVFDVTKGEKFYAQGGGYHCFAGRDASKAFVTGDFTESGLTDDLDDVSEADLADLQTWLHMYEKDYAFKGKLIGRFYDSHGEPTPYLKAIWNKIHSFDVEKLKETNIRLRYPPCNIEWTPERGSRVWCSKESGGVKRDWVGLPRNFYDPSTSVHRCACMNPKEDNYDGKFELYDGCKPDSLSCFIKTEK